LIETIKDGNEEIAIIVTKDSFEERVTFITPEHYPLQFGILKYQKGDCARPHTHPNVPRTISQSQEMIHVDKGKIKLDIFNSKGKLCASRLLEEGDCAFFVSGGRSWTALEESKILKVKQGPFRGEKDKILL